MSKNNKKIAIGASALIVAGILSGGTFALWQDSANLTSGTVTAGHMNITAGSSEWRDISTVNGAKATIASFASLDGREIDLSTFRTVPGDTIAGIQEFDIDLEGDNLEALVSVAADGGSTGTLLSDTEGVTVETILFDNEGDIVARASGATTSVTFVSPEWEDAHDNAVPAGAVVADDTPNDLRVGVVAYFDSNTPDSVREDAAAELAAATVTIEQARK